MEAWLSLGPWEPCYVYTTSCMLILAHAHPSIRLLRCMPDVVLMSTLKLVLTWECPSSTLSPTNDLTITHNVHKRSVTRTYIPCFFIITIKGNFRKCKREKTVLLEFSPESRGDWLNPMMLQGHCPRQTDVHILQRMLVKHILCISTTQYLVIIC